MVTHPTDLGLDIEKGMKLNKKERFKKSSFSRVREQQKRYPLNPIEVWSFDERIVGLKPILGKVWAPIGERSSSIVYQGASHFCKSLKKERK